MLGYLRLVVNPRDDEAFKRCVNTPARGIGDTTIARIATIAATRQVSMWEAVDTLVAEAPSDPVERTVVRKVAEFVGLIRSFRSVHEEKGLYDFGLDVASRSGLLPHYRLQNTPEATSAVQNIEELLNTMQEFNERRESEIRTGEREDGARATVDEWLQEVMLMTDMDNEEGSEGRVTLMTVHSSKGLEYKYVYIVGCEENLFPSLRAMETIEGLEEERRLFYVALTRAKALATLSCADMRFIHGQMEFSRPSRFLKEIDPQFVVTDMNLNAAPRGRSGDGEESAIDRLRQRYDMRFQSRGARPSDEAPRCTEQPRVVPRPVSAPPRDVSGMRRVAASPVGATTTSPCDYAVGERVEHPRFGCGEVVRIEPLATDHKIVVRFDSEGEKTLIAKLAKLKKL